MKKLAMFTALLSICCFFVDALEARTPEGEFRIAVSNLAGEVLDPISGPVDAKWYLTLMYDSIVGVEPPSPGLSAKTGVASGWKHSPDYKVWTFVLRKGIKFHNGDEVTAEDVKFSLERASGPASVASHKSSLISTIHTIEVVDQYTVRIHCKGSDSLIPMTLSEAIGTEAMIVPKKYIEEKGDRYFRLHPIGTGPYKFLKHVPGEHILLEAVDRHWALGVPRYKYVKLSVVPESIARLGLLKRGEVDMVDLPREGVAEVKAIGIPVVEDPAQATFVYTMGDTWKSEYPVSDIRVREALNISIDREAIQQTLFGGLGKLAPYPTATEASIGYKPADKHYPYDPNRAKILLKDAGYDSKKPLKITLYSCPLGSVPEQKQTAEVLASYWKEIGINVEVINVAEFSVIRKMFVDRSFKGTIAPNAFGGRIWAMPVTRVLAHSASPYEVSKVPELDKAIDAALGETDADKRSALAHKVFQIIYNQYFHIPLIEIPGLYALNPKTVPDYKKWEMGPIVFDVNLEWVLFR